MIVKIGRADGSVEEMGVDEFTKWMCLVEAFYFIDQKAKELKVNVDNLVKPMMIEQYILTRFPGMRHDVECEARLGRL
jgi:hypothetical protein